MAVRGWTPLAVSDRFISCCCLSDAAAVAAAVAWVSDALSVLPSEVTELLSLLDGVNRVPVRQAVDSVPCSMSGE